MEGHKVSQSSSGQQGGIIQDILGLSHQQSMMMYLTNQQTYWKALSEAVAPTPDMKNAQFANPDDVSAHAQYDLRYAAKRRKH